MDIDYIENKVIEWEKALSTLKAALLIPNISELERDGAIQRFEYCFELAWKVFKIVIKDHKGQEVLSPKEAFKTAILLNIIESEEIWQEILRRRNTSVHTYIESLAIDLYHLLPRFYQQMIISLVKIKELYNIK